MKNTTTTGTLTLFSVRADYWGCEYGSLYTVAANDADEASDLVRAYITRIFASHGEDMQVTIEEVDAIGTLIDAEPKVLDSFAT